MICTVEEALHLPFIFIDVYKIRGIYSFVPFFSVLEFMDITISLFL